MIILYLFAFENTIILSVVFFPPAIYLIINYIRDVPGDQFPSRLVVGKKN